MTDNYLWLEEVHSENALNWVKNENSDSTKKLKTWSEFKSVSSKILESLESKDKIPTVNFIEGGYVYNLWTDEDHKQGLFRRASIVDFSKPICAWEVLIDLDQESNRDKEKWVYHYFRISPNKKTALVALSPGGTDADIIREFCLIDKKFIVDGFRLELSKGQADWLSQDEIFVMREFGADSVTSCGYPRAIRTWKRGEKLSEAAVNFSIPKEESFVFTSVSHFENKSRILAYRLKDFYHNEIYEFDSAQFKKLDLPPKMEDYGITEDYFYIHLQENWQHGEESYLSGDVITYHFDSKKTELLYRPEAQTTVYSGSASKSGLYLILDRDVKSELFFFSNNKGGNKAWSKEKINLPQNGSLDFLVTDTESDIFYVAFDSFNVPMTYFYGEKLREPMKIKTQKSFFNHEDLEVHQHFTPSKDGTMIPYFIVHKKGLEYNSKNPTILYGYGGFNISVKPHFNNALGIAWLEKGGVYVIANIRGGGEYGPKWHQSGLKDKRDRIYQDFFCVAEDLFAKKVTCAQHLGAKGRSNGGLLMGVCYTQRPDLFRAIDCGVPLLDMKRYHKLLAGHSWIAEYGNPDEESDGEYIRKLSPYHRLNSECNPKTVIYLNTSTKDDRVHPGHARKFAAKLKELNHPYFYYENIEGGHAGAANMSELSDIQTFSYAFFWQHLR